MQAACSNIATLTTKAGPPKTVLIRNNNLIFFLEFFKIF